MRQRLHAGKPAEITFTYDFHELVAGDLRPGGPLLLRYDPIRIVPAEEPYRFGDPERPVMAHVRFGEGEAPIDVPLRSPGGIAPCPDVDLTGQGSAVGSGHAARGRRVHHGLVLGRDDGIARDPLRQRLRRQLPVRLPLPRD